MTSAAFPMRRHPSVQHRTPTAFALAVLMHALLVAGMSLMVRWNTQPAAPVVAELWSAVPPPVEVAPPPPPPPAPAPTPAPPPPPPPPVEPEKKPDIVSEEVKKPKIDPEIEKRRLEEEKRRLEEERRRIEEQKRLEAEKKAAEEKRLAEEKRKAEERKKQELERKLAEQKAAAEREAQRKKDLERLLAQAAAAPGVQSSAGSSRGEADYVARLSAHIKQHIAYSVPDGTSPQVVATFTIEQLPTGEVVRIRLVRSSGLAGYDAAVERAIARASPLPRKPDGTVTPVLTIDFRPVDTK